MLGELQGKKPVFTHQINSLMNAFYRMSRERNYCGQDASPLSIKERDILEYIERHDSCDHPSDIFMDIINGIDSFYLNLCAEKKKAMLAQQKLGAAR